MAAAVSERKPYCPRGAPEHFSSREILTIANEKLLPHCGGGFKASHDQINEISDCNKRTAIAVHATER